jgi:hypothetical protein
MVVYYLKDLWLQVPLALPVLPISLRMDSIGVGVVIGAQEGNGIMDPNWIAGHLIGKLDSYSCQILVLNFGASLSHVGAI